MTMTMVAPSTPSSRAKIATRPSRAAAATEKSEERTRGIVEGEGRGGGGGGSSADFLRQDEAAAAAAPPPYQIEEAEAAEAEASHWRECCSHVWRCESSLSGKSSSDSTWSRQR